MKPRITGFSADEIAKLRAASPELSEKIRAATIVSRKIAKLSAEDQVESLELDDELRAYCKRFRMDPEATLEDWRLSKRGNNYMVGRNPISDARAAFMYWIRKSSYSRPQQQEQSRLIAPADTLRRR